MDLIGVAFLCGDTLFLQICIGKQWKESLDHNETIGFIFHVCFLSENDPFPLPAISCSSVHGHGVRSLLS